MPLVVILILSLRNAFDYTGQRIRLTLGSGYGDLLGNPQYQFKGSYSNLFGAKKNIGITISANFNRSDRGATWTRIRLGRW